jgi:cysteine desulfurase
VIYLDHNATTPVDPRVFAAMEPFLRESFGNPSSVHRVGREARRAVEEARDSVAELLGAGPEEIVFTSGGTESDALAVSSASARAGKPPVVISSVEHPAVREVARRLKGDGHEVREIPVLKTGALDLDAAREALGGAGLVSVMTANNEYGGLFPIPKMAFLAHETGALFHTDAVAAAGKIPLRAREWGVDLLSISAHKIYGPKGVGALFVRRGLDLVPLFPGGGQERRRRGGTENVPGIVGFGAAARILREELAEEGERLTALRDEFERLLHSRIPGIRVWGAAADRIGSTSSVEFPGRSGEAMLIDLDLAGIAVSVGSACSSGTVSPSTSILALGADRRQAEATLRFSFGRGNGSGQLPEIVETISACCQREVRA